MVMLFPHFAKHYIYYQTQMMVGWQIFFFEQTLDFNYP